MGFGGTPVYLDALRSMWPAEEHNAANALVSPALPERLRLRPRHERRSHRADPGSDQTQFRATATVQTFAHCVRSSKHARQRALHACEILPVETRQPSTP